MTSESRARRVRVVLKNGQEFEAVNEGETHESLTDLFPENAFDSELTAAADGDYWTVTEK